MSLSSSTAHLPTLASPLSSLGADGGCGSPPHVVVTGGTWGSQLTLAEHPTHMSSLGAHGGAARIAPAALVVVQCCTLVEEPLYHPIVVVGITCSLRLTLVEGILAAASSWPSSGLLTSSLGLLTSSSWLGSHAAHGLGRESQRLCHGWDHTRSASEWQRVVGSSLSGLCAANLKASWWSGTHAACGWRQRSCIDVIVILAVELSAITVRSTTARRRRAQWHQ